MTDFSRRKFLKTGGIAAAAGAAPGKGLAWMRRAWPLPEGTESYFWAKN